MVGEEPGTSLCPARVATPQIANNEARVRHRAQFGGIQANRPLAKGERPFWAAACLRCRESKTNVVLDDNTLGTQTQLQVQGTGVAASS